MGSGGRGGVPKVYNRKIPATDLTCKVLFYPPRTAPELPVTTGVGLGFWVVPSSHILKTEYPCHFCGKGFSGATVRDIGYQLDSQWDISHPTFNLSLIV